MEGLSGGYNYGQSDLDFPSADGQLSSTVPSFPPLHLSYPHIQHGGASHRESAFTAHGRLPPGGDMYALPRFPIVPDIGIRPNFNHLLSRQLSHSPPLPLPHISSFSDPSASYISHSGDRTSISVSQSAESLSDHPSFGSIMASAASNISTMNIPHPYNMNVNTQNDGLQNRTDLNTGYSGASTASSEYLSNFNPVPVSSSSNILSQSPEPRQSTSGLNTFPTTNSSPPTSQTMFTSSRIQPSLSSARIVHPDHVTNTVACQSRVLQSVSMENLDGDQQVPNAVMSPSSNCSSPSLRNTSTPDNRHIGNLLRQAVNNDSIANHTVHSDNMANLRNEQSFANATLIGAELCNSKFMPSLPNRNKNAPQHNIYANTMMTENSRTEHRNDSVLSRFQLDKRASNEPVNENHNRAGPSRLDENFTGNLNLGHTRNCVNDSVDKVKRMNTISHTTRRREKVTPKVRKKLDLVDNSDSDCSSDAMSSRKVHNNNNVTFLKMGNLADQRSRSSMEISSALLNFMAQFSSNLLSKENLPACLEYEVDFARMEEEVVSKLLRMRNGDSFLPYQTQDDEDGIIENKHPVNSGNSCYGNYSQIGRAHV